MVKLLIQIIQKKNRNLIVHGEKGRIIYLQGIFRDNQHILKKMTDEHRSDIQKQFVDMETKLKNIYDQTQLGRF